MSPEIPEVPGGFWWILVDSKHNISLLGIYWCLMVHLMHLVGTAFDAFGWNFIWLAMYWWLMHVIGASITTGMIHIAKLHCTEWYNLLNTYIVSNDTGLVDAVEHSMYICTYYSNKWVHQFSKSMNLCIEINHGQALANGMASASAKGIA